MKKFLNFSLMVTFLMSTAAILNSCKKDFDQPPGAADPNIVANTSIKALKALHTSSGAYTIITTDLIISGVVVANDRSGNLYKQLFIEDSTGGLQILLDANSLFGSYPVGRRIFIRCKDLCISDFNNTMQLGVKALVAGLPSMEAIPGSLISKYVVGGSINNPVVAKVVTIADLSTSFPPTNQPWQNPYIGTLIQLNDFAFTDLSKTYSDTSVYKNTQNRDIKNCSNQTIIVRTSAYSNFAGQKVAQGRGSIISVYTVFGSTKQLLLRDSSDVKFTADYACALPPGTLLFEDFESQVVPSTAPYNPVSIPGWMNVAEAGGKLYDGRIFSNNKYAYMSGFGTNAATVTTWLVTKGVNLNATATETLTFKTIQGFILTTTPGGTPVQAGLKVLLSTNYTGTGNPWAATWTDVTSQATLSPGSTTSSFPGSFTNSGNISLSSYSGTIYVAFKYEGADPAGTTSDKTSAWEVDDVRIIGN